MNSSAAFLASAIALSLLSWGSSIAQEQEDDPMDAFRKASKEAKKENVPASAPAPQAPAKSSSSGSSQSNAGTFNLYCSGEIKRSTGSMVVKREQIEFRTVLNLGKGTHKVVNVVNGPLFSSGSQYDALSLENNMVVLGAEINGKEHWKISSVRLDLDSSKLSGQGTVDLTQVRSMLNARLMERGKSLPEGGLDAQRKIQVDGSCQQVG